MSKAMVSKKRIWLAVLPAMVVPFLASLFYFVIFSEHTFARWLYGAAKLFIVLWPVFAMPIILKTPLPRPKLAEPKHRQAIQRGVVTGLLTY